MSQENNFVGYIFGVKLTMAGFSSFQFKKYRWLILLVVVVILPIVSLLHMGALLLYRRQNLYFVANHYIHDTSSTITETSCHQRSSNIEYKGGELLTGRVRKFSNFIAELNSSEHRQFDSGVLNFSYAYDHIDMEQVFTKEFSGYDSLPANKTASYPGGYIFVLSVGQELSQCTIHLLELCLYAATSHRKVVTPRMSNGGMRIGGLPFGEFFDVPRLNKQLLRFGYSELATEDEFKSNCENQRKKVLVVFYDKPESRGSPQAFHAAFRDKLDMYEKVKKAGWLNCTQYITEIPKTFEKDRNNADYFCMDGNLFGADVELFNQKVLGDSKCVFINSWVQLYNVHWNRLIPAGAPYAYKILYWFLDPSREIIDEANAFRDMRIQRPYVAIHIRGVKFKNHSFVEPCFDVALEFVNALRRTRKVKTLFLSTDMSQFGGITNKDKNSHQLFAEKSGAVIYDPNVAKRLKRIDRWKVSLTEARLLTQSDHLITLGQGSFGNFIRNRYLWEHRNKQNWTFSKLCMGTAKRFF